MARPKLRDPTTEDRIEHAALLSRLEADGRGPLHKMQSTLARLERFWMPIQPAYQIREVISPKRGIVPRAVEVELVTRFARHTSAVVRQHVLRVVKHAKTHGELVLPVVRRGLVDEDILVRVAAAVAAYELRAGVPLQEELLAALDSATWKARWYAAAALASTSHRERAGEVFAASFPENGNRFFGGVNRYVHEWYALANAFSPPTAPIAARLGGKTSV